MRKQKRPRRRPRRTLLSIQKRLRSPSVVLTFNVPMSSSDDQKEILHNLILIVGMNAVTFLANVVVMSSKQRVHNATENIDNYFRNFEKQRKQQKIPITTQNIFKAAFSAL